MATDASPKYNITCVNATEKSYHFGVYISFPESPDLTSVIWKIRGLPPKGRLPSKAEIKWSMNYGLYIGQWCWDETDSVCTGEQFVDAEVGKKYEVLMTGGDIPAIQQSPTGSSGDGIIDFHNSTNLPLVMGFTVDGCVIAKQNVGASETITAHVGKIPTFHVAVYRTVTLGQPADSGVELGPVMIKYDNGYTRSHVEAAVNAGKHLLKDPVYDSY